MSATLNANSLSGLPIGFAMARLKRRSLPIALSQVIHERLTDRIRDGAIET